MVQTIPPNPNPKPSKQRHRCLVRIVVTSVVCLVMGVPRRTQAPPINCHPLNGWVGGLWGSYQARVTETPPPPTTSRLILIRGMRWWGWEICLSELPLNQVVCE
ncbi:hypothetical protein [Mycoplasmoides pneumoniae]|uniref:hypothetical protein n=1 Tax=Mycoplasmoides pneumoniae TaxID=2104 RepID=UPI003A5C83C9